SGNSKYADEAGENFQWVPRPPHLVPAAPPPVVGQKRPPLFLLYGPGPFFCFLPGLVRSSQRGPVQVALSAYLTRFQINIIGRTTGRAGSPAGQALPQHVSRNRNLYRNYPISPQIR